MRPWLSSLPDLVPRLIGFRRPLGCHSTESLRTSAISQCNEFNYNNGAFEQDNMLRARVR